MGSYRCKFRSAYGRGENRAERLRRMEHTGPGVWTDAVLAYLKARYNVSWHDLRGLQHPLRIGEVLILPITGKLLSSGLLDVAAYPD